MTRTGRGLALAAAAVALTAGGVAGTMAWMNARTGTADNAITLGKVGIDLDEHAYDPVTGKLTGDIVRANTYDNAAPGVIYPKDPTVHVEPGSADCYLFLRVAKGFVSSPQEATAAALPDYTPVAGQLDENWAVYSDGKAGQYLYYVYKGQNAAGDNIFTPSAPGVTLDLPTLTAFAIAPGVGRGTALADIAVRAAAIQSAGLSGTAEAFSKLPEDFRISPGTP